METAILISKYNFSHEVMIPEMHHFIPYTYNCGFCKEPLDAVIKLENFATEFEFLSSLLKFKVGRHYKKIYYYFFFKGQTASKHMA